MAESDVSPSDRSIGSMLSGDEVETLREAVQWARKHHGVRYREIAEDSRSPEHSVRNFANRKSIRPDNAFLGKLHGYFAANKHFITKPLNEPVGRIAQVRRQRPWTYAKLRVNGSFKM